MQEVVKIKVGSHLFGTNTPKSDTDFKGVFIPSISDLFWEGSPNSLKLGTKKEGSRKNTPDDIDFESYYLPYFIQMACSGDVITIDMLHAPDHMILYKSPVWDHIVSLRAKFYTRDLTKLNEYARKQAAKYGLKGSRLNVCYEFKDWLSRFSPNTRLQEVWDILPITEFSRMVLSNKNNLPEFEILEKRFSPRTRIKYVLEAMESFFNKYGSRAIDAAQNKGVDWKAVSHAVRAALQVKQILTTGTITFPFEKEDAELLMNIKLGKLDYSSVVEPTLENLIDEVKDLSAKSDLPDKVDVEYWKSLTVSMMAEYAIPEHWGC